MKLANKGTSFNNLRSDLQLGKLFSEGIVRQKQIVEIAKWQNFSTNRFAMVTRRSSPLWNVHLIN